MAIAEGVRLARTISSSSRFVMKSKARTKTRPCSSKPEIPVPDKKTAIAILLSRDAALGSPTLRAGG